VVGYNVQAAVDAKHHLIVTHEVTNTGHDRDQLSGMAGQAKAAIGLQALDVLADRGYFDGEEMLACEGIGVTPYVPKPLTLGSKAKGRFGKQDFVYLADDDVYPCPAGKTLTRRFTSVEDGINVSVARIPGEDYPAALGDYGPDPSGAERRVQCRIRDLWLPCSWPTG
jgi:transposase